MKKGMMLIMSCALAFPAIALAKATHTKVPPTQAVRKNPSTIETPKSGFILKQDLFDRNNPNNLRSDWPSPPAQPGSF